MSEANMKAVVKAKMRIKLLNGNVPEFSHLTEYQKDLFLDGYDEIIDKYDLRAIVANPFTRRKFKKDMKTLEEKVKNAKTPDPC